MAKSDDAPASNQPAPVADAPKPTADVRAEAQANEERRNAVVYRYNLDGSYTMDTGPMPPGVITPQDLLNAWQAQSAGSVNGGTQWLDTFRVPANQEFDELLQGARAAGLYHWSDGTQSLIVLPNETDVARLQDEFTRTVRGEGIDATFDANGNPL